MEWDRYTGSRCTTGVHNDKTNLYKCSHQSSFSSVSSAYGSTFFLPFFGFSSK